MNRSEFEQTLFLFTIRLNIDDILHNGFLMSVPADDNNKIIPFAVTCSDFIQNTKKNISVHILCKDNGMLNFDTQKSNWHISDNGIAVLPLGGVFNHLQADMIANKVIPENFLIAEEDKENISLIETTYTFTYPENINNGANSWPMCYTAETASPIMQNFDNKPYFIVNTAPDFNIAGSPVFIKTKTLLKEKIIFAGMWIPSNEEKKQMIGNIPFSAVLKAEEISCFMKKIKQKIDK